MTDHNNVSGGLGSDRNCALIISQTFYLLHEEGFFVGASSGLNVAAAVQVNRT